jgi:hypothetical protein
MSEVSASSGATVDWDHTGRVISSTFSCGHVCQFRYDANGILYGFTYARLAWSTIDGINWTSRDQLCDWQLTARVTVREDGTIRIEKDHVTRVLRLNGTMRDEFPDGTNIESMRPTAEVTPADLMAVSVPRAFVREPQGISSSQIIREAELSQQAGEPPAAKEDAADTPGAVRRVIAGGMRMSKLRVAEDETAPRQSLKDEARVAFDTFVASTAIRLLEVTKGAEALELVPFLDKMAATCHRERRVEEARLLHERALTIRRAHQGPDHSDTGINLHALGRIYLEWGRYTEAEQFLLDAVKTHEKGLRKTRFMHSTAAVTDVELREQLQHLINSLHSLCSLYHEQRKLHLCGQLYESAVSACNSVDESHRQNLSAPLESLAAMAAQAELEQQPLAKKQLMHRFS